MSDNKYVVETYDAYDAPGDRKHLRIGEYAKPEEALACAMNIIDTYLRQQIMAGKNASDAAISYSQFGEIPILLGDYKFSFQPYDYARAKAILLVLELEHSPISIK